MAFNNLADMPSRNVYDFSYERKAVVWLRVVYALLLRPVYTGDFCRGDSMEFLLHQVSNMLETPAISR